jgi:hypothetical protein
LPAWYRELIAGLLVLLDLKPLAYRMHGAAASNKSKVTSYSIGIRLVGRRAGLHGVASPSASSLPMLLTSAVTLFPETRLQPC